ncbi:MAG: tetratricopeptide repeat protein [Candidatus Hydrogenedentes bacterium]|nr:tetratricopeptide repeat protein [Candidatus Hydrogenedentota bacterium]
MVEKENGQPVAEEESTGNATLDKRLASGVLKGDSGTEAAQVWISAFLIAAFGFLVYLGSFSIPLHGADLRLLHDSQALHRIVTSPDAVEMMPTSPLSAPGLALICALSAGRTDALHGFALLLHLCCAILVFLIARRLLPKGAPEVVAMLAGLVFVAHPALSGTVNYLAAYPVLQASLFGLGGLLLLLRGADGSANFPLHLAGAVGCFVLAFGSDTSAILLPAAGMALLVLRREGEEDGYGSRRIALPVLAATMAVCWITGQAAGVFAPGVVAAGFVEAFRNFLGLCGQGLIAVIWPFGFSLIPEPGGLVVGVLAFALLMAGVAATLRGIAVLPQVALWFLFAALGAACYGDASLQGDVRFLYLPLAALAVLLPWGLLQIPSPGVYRAAGAAASVAVIVLGVLAFQATNTWKSPELIWEAEAQRNPESAVPWAELGRYHETRARLAAQAEDEAQQTSRLEAAANAWRNVIERDPEHPEAEKNLGIIAFERGDFPEAARLLGSAAPRLPEDQEIAVYLGLSHEQLARGEGGREAMASAFRAFRRADRLGELPPVAQARYGMLAAAVGELDLALPLLQAATGGEEEHPMSQSLQFYQGVAEQAQMLSQRSEAILREQPDAPEGLILRAERLLAEGRALSAFYLLQYVIDAAPAQDAAWALLGFASARIESADQFLAERAASRAGNAAAWEQLATRTAAGGLWDAAEAYLRHGGAAAIPEVKLAEIAMQLRQPPRAQAYLEAAQQAHPDSPEPWLRLADLAIAAGENARAAALIDAAESRGAAPEALKERRDRLGGATAPTTSGIERTVIR